MEPSPSRLVAVLLRYFVLVAGVAALSSYIAIYTHTGNAPIRSDGYSYYVYLPSWLLYGDVTLEAPARDCCGGAYPTFTGITRWPQTGRWVNPHPIGVAILMAPFFVLAHLLTRWSNLPPDGFSLYYQHAAALAGLSYFLLGVAVLRRTLSRHCSPAIVLATLATLTWGTNLFHYGVYDATFSHAFSFFLICALAALTERWWIDDPTLSCTTAFGATAALIVLTRHANVIFLIMLPLYGITRWSHLRQRPAALWSRRGALAVMIVVMAVGVLPQLAIYRAATGVWLTSPYAALDVGFRFGSPHLFGVLFSTEKGLFFWSPVLLLAVVGWVTAEGWARSFVVPAAIILTLDTYLIASWSDWQFGGSYGHRAFTDSFGLMAIFLAASFAWIAKRPRLVAGASIGVALAVLLSVVQMIQYWTGILPIANTTWDQYRALFLRFS